MSYLASRNVSLFNSTVTASTLKTNTMTYSTMVGSTITASSITTPAMLGTVILGQNITYPNRYLEVGTDASNTMYLDFHSNDATLPDYSTRIQSYGGSTTGTGTLALYGSTIGLVPLGGVGVGTTNPIGKFEIYGGANNGHLRMTDENNNGSSSTLYYPVVSYYARQDGVIRTTTPLTSTNGASASIVFTDRPGTSSFPTAVRNSDILFYTADNLLVATLGIYPKERMRITAEGYVGIGKTTPSTTLDVQGSAYIGNTVAGGTVVTLNTGAPAGVRGLSIYYNSGGTSGSATGDYSVIQSGYGGVANTPIALNPSGGNVGIGTNAPITSLHVQGDMFVSNKLYLNSYAGFINPTGSGGVWNNACYFTSFDDGAGMAMNAYTSYQGGAYTSRMVIKSNGNVGIGTTNPSALVHINSNVTLASTANSYDIIQRWFESTINSNYVDLMWIRTSAGTDWNTSGQRFQSKTDATWQGFIEFNGINNPYGVTIGAGSSTSSPNSVPGVLYVKSNGYVGIGTTGPGYPLQIWGTGGVNSTATLAITNGANSNNGYGAQVLFQNITGVYNVLVPLGSIACLRENNAANYSAYMQFNLGNQSGSGATYEVMRINSSGYVGIGTASPTAPLHVWSTNNSGGAPIFKCTGVWGNNAGVHEFLIQSPPSASTTSANAAGAVGYILRDEGTGRSLNASGTYNASGNDYAEYMYKGAEFTAKKGDIIGINNNGLITNQYDHAVCFMIKSTNPSYVGGDDWGSNSIVGTKPNDPGEFATDAERLTYQTELESWNHLLEVERQKVDRISFSGQVPVNVLHANPGDYIVPLRSSEGLITGVAISEENITFVDYRKSVGRVIKVLDDGRAFVIVKVI